MASLRRGAIRRPNVRAYCTHGGSHDTTTAALVKEACLSVAYYELMPLIRVNPQY